MKKVIHGWLAAVGVLLVVWLAVASAYARIVDRIVAIVNEEPITASDLNWAVTIETRQAGQGKQSPGAVLKRLIDERLIAQEAANAPPIDIAVAEVDAAVERLQSRFPSPAALAETLHEHGLSPAELRRQFRQKIQVLKFADQRFRPFIIVPPDEIQTYYETEFRAELQKRYVVKVPDLADVRETIQALLVERKLNQELERWIQELRERAVIRVLVQPE